MRKLTLEDKQLLNEFVHETIIPMIDAAIANECKDDAEYEHLSRAAATYLIKKLDAYYA